MGPCTMECRGVDLNSMCFVTPYCMETEEIFPNWIKQLQQNRGNAPIEPLWDSLERQEKCAFGVLWGVGGSIFNDSQKNGKCHKLHTNIPIVIAPMD